ncbi:oligosaccharide biosynthesis protein Alg14 like-domain-containing protein [Coniella lustricola]|uniref:UDP-N-acetylglucosamine transferase subunit ALG14 n=1 Tax=Coniella lustricola TaxID=2025994 RepID=A0A2T3AGI8_9PEZI|nr:oligosaccharide biosynthesis protein Alg14 like-domain-containing protein [Coniella lustricola]
MTTWLGLSALASLFWIAAAYHYSGVVAAGWAITIPGVLVAQVILFRVILVCRRSSSVRAQLEPGLMSGKKDAGPDLSQLPAVSYLYVLGSGGHTTEMIAIIKQSFKANKNQHRRYIITDGDTHSLNQSKALENLIRASCPDDAGTHDTLMVTRARAVHQSFITSVFTSAKSALDIIAALTAVPSQRRYGPDSALFKWPHVIVTNGPGTGFIVGLVAFALKVVCRVPKDRLKVVFVETWARDNKLGLTGKLFNMTGIADLFVVQSPLLAKAVGKPNIGNINFRYAQLPRPGPTASNDKME